MHSRDPSDRSTDGILDHLPDGVIAVDRSATITYLTAAAAARILALHPGTALDKPPGTLLGHAVTEALRFNHGFAGQSYVKRETERPRVTGEPRLISFSVLTGLTHSCGPSSSTPGRRRIPALAISSGRRP